jgi:hypothetical protein
MSDTNKTDWGCVIIIVAVILAGTAWDIAKLIVGK